MADSVKERIMQNYEAALKVVSIANGYKRDLELVERFKLPTMDQNLNAIVEIKQGFDVKREAALGVEERTLSIHTVVKVRHDSGDDGLSTDAVLNDHEEDIYRAALADETRGGLTSGEGMRWVATEELENDEPGVRVALSINFDVDYRHQLGDMTL